MADPEFSASTDDLIRTATAWLDAAPDGDIRDELSSLVAAAQSGDATELAGRFSHRFKGICSERAVNNLLTEEFTSDISTIFRVEHGPRHIDDPQAYESLSPMRNVRDITVPMLIVHSERDLRC